MKRLNVAIVGAKFMVKRTVVHGHGCIASSTSQQETWADWFMGKVTQEISQRRSSVRRRMSPS